MPRKWISFAFVFIFLFSLAIPSAQAAFPDVKATTYGWAQEAIDFMADRQVIQGYRDGSFKPGKSVTKAELTVMLYRLFPKLRTSEPQSIPGVPATHWASKEFAEVYGTTWPIYAADKQNWLTESFSYSPDKALTRWEVMLVLDALFDNLVDEKERYGDQVLQTLAEAKDVQKKVLSSEQRYDQWWKTASTMSPIVGVDRNDSSGIEISSDIEYLKAEALHTFVYLGVMTLDNQGKFYPSRLVTRAEIATILYRLYQVPPVEPPVDPLAGLPEGGSRVFIYPQSGSGWGGYDLYDYKDHSYTTTAVFLPDPDGSVVKRVRLTVDSAQTVDLYVTVDGVTTMYTYEQLTDAANPIIIPVENLLYVSIDFKARYPERLTEDGNNKFEIFVEDI